MPPLRRVDDEKRHQRIRRRICAEIVFPYLVSMFLILKFEDNTIVLFPQIVRVDIRNLEF